MSTYIISYDLKNASEEQYKTLYSKIKDYGTWAHITESTFAVATEQTSSQVRDNLEQFIPTGSSIFIVKSGVEAAWKNVICSNEWLKKNL